MERKIKMIETRKTGYTLALAALQKAEQKLFNLQVQLQDLQIHNGDVFCELVCGNEPCRAIGSPCSNEKGSCKDVANFRALQGNFQSEQMYVKGAIEKACESLALGEAGAEQRLKQAKVLLQRSNAEQADSALMIEVLARLIAKTKAEIASLTSAVDISRRAVLHEVYTELKGKIQVAVGNLIVEAFCIRGLAGISVNMGQICTDIFPQPGLDETSLMQSTLIEKYLAV